MTGKTRTEDWARDVTERDGRILASMRWRVGRRVGRTIYVCITPEPSDVDALIGVMDSPELAAEAVAAHNGRLESSRGR
jgi:hypothetical protein